MRALVQRVSGASVTVDEEVVGSIDRGLCVFVGVTHDDTPAHASKLAGKLFGLRVFDDDDGVMNRSVADVGGAMLIISQFTLYADTRKGRRPGYSAAAKPDVAEPLVQSVVDELLALGASVQTGRFRADMTVALVNDGPITLSIEV